MTEMLLGFVPQYGLPVIMCAVMIGMLGIPLPTSFIVMAGGAFAASGDIDLVALVGLVYLTATTGDQIGYRVGRLGGAALFSWLRKSRRRGAQLDRAVTFSDKWGALGVFFSRWLVSPLGPYVNYASGAAGLGWRGFTAASLAGEAIWVSFYIGLGWFFADSLEAIADIVGNASFLLVGLALSSFLALRLWRAKRARPVEIPSKNRT